MSQHGIDVCPICETIPCTCREVANDACCKACGSTDCICKDKSMFELERSADEAFEKGRASVRPPPSTMNAKVNRRLKAVLISFVYEFPTCPPESMTQEQRRDFLIAALVRRVFEL